MVLSSKIREDEWVFSIPDRAGDDRSSSLKHGNPLINFNSLGPRMAVESGKIICAPDNFSTTTDLLSKSCKELDSILISLVCRRQLAILNSRTDVSDKKDRNIDKVCACCAVRII